MSRETTYYKALIPIGSAIIFAGVAGYLYYKLFDKEEDIDIAEENAPFVQLTTIEIKIPPNAVGAIIGRQGSSIKKIQDLTSTAIRFRDEENGERTCVIRGKVEKAIKAKEIILNVIQNVPNINEEEIDIPNNFIGKIIGRSGYTIQKLQRESGATIKVPFSKEKVTGFVGPNCPRKVLIRGTREQITAAKNGIYEVIEEEKKLRVDIKNSASNISHRYKRFTHQNGEIPTINGIDINSSELEKSSECLTSSSDFNEVYVSAVATGAHFWVQLVGPKTVQLDKLVSQMSEYYENSGNRESHKLSSFEIGKIVAAKFNDGMWYRGKIIEPEDPKQDKISVFFVDFGDTDEVESSFVCDLRTDFLTLSYQALECYLADVDIESGDDKTATDAFESLSYAAKWKPLMVRVMGYKREGSLFIPYVKVIDTNGSEDIDIAEEMIKRGLIQRSKDSVAPSKLEEDYLDTLDDISDLDDISLE